MIGKILVASRKPLNQVKARIQRLRRDSVEVAANSGRIVRDGVQKLAEQELKALNAYYRSATASLRSARGPGGSGYQDMAATQLDLLDKTIRKVAGNAMEALSVLSDARAELARLVEPEPPPTRLTALKKMTAPARKVVADVRKAATRAQKGTNTTVRKVRRSLEKEWAYAEKRGRSAVRRGETKARKVGTLAGQALGSILDRASPPSTRKKPLAGTAYESARVRRNDPLKLSD